MNYYPLTLLLVVAYVYACRGAEIPPPTVYENGEVVRTYLGVDVYKTERACARLGGLCVHKSDCQSPSTMSGLCPESAHRGVECCYEVIPVKGELNCAEYLGECMTSCNAIGLRRPAKDCEEDEICCVLTN
ncbi:U-scoloptoxin(19)-Sm1a [Topomyia yanbarensis]|uniref:U-scoloptoxin(19)-Sm1a n=1 Tax=Topomyia yanbarensis TaxID=2498891 RepID=UPI00273AE0BA|nr:U-scoloptoxin(19)-Sm1a [Topomyia yanbarensis]XP_058830374.1 U-scoloptoxin(19)-Sm1a [Topomyia yanbarensis]